jgi:hypothetical protein
MENKGNTDIELLMLEVLVPKLYVSPHWGPASVGVYALRKPDGRI